VTGANQAEGEQGDEDEAEGEQGDADEAEGSRGMQMRLSGSRGMQMRPRVLLQCAGGLGGATMSPPSSTQAEGGQDRDQTYW